MKKTISILSIVLVVTLCALMGCVYKLYQGYKADDVSTTDSIDLDKLAELSNDYITSVTGTTSVLTYEKVIQVEYQPNNQLLVLGVVLSNDKYNYANCTIAYNDSYTTIRDRINNCTNFNLTLKSYYDFDTTTLLNYCGFEEGDASLMVGSRTTSDAGYVYSFDIYVYSNTFRYVYTSNFTSAKTLTSSALSTAIEEVLANGTYNDEEVTSSVTSIQRYTTLDNTYIFNY